VVAMHHRRMVINII